MTHEIKVTINSVDYLLHANNVKRSLKNNLIKVQRPLTKGRQDGNNEPDTIIVDIKRVTDVLTVSGEVRPQTISGTYKDAIASFNLLATALKRHSSCAVVYRGVTYNGSLEQLESEDRSDTIQGYVNASNVRVKDIPNKVKCTISFIIGTVR